MTRASAGRGGVGEGGNKRWPGWRGCLVGMGCGALAALLYFLYFWLTRPSTYSLLFLLAYGPVLVIFGGAVGLVFAVVRDPD